MSLTHNKFSAEILFALLSAPVFLAAGGLAHAQAVRSVQMSLFEFGQESFGLPQSGRGTPSRADTDIVSFGEKSGQPSAAYLDAHNLPIFTIMYSATPDTELTPDSLPYYEWARIIALVVLCALNVAFWGVYEQQGSSLQFWADRSSDRHILRWLEHQPFRLY